MKTKVLLSSALAVAVAMVAGCKEIKTPDPEPYAISVTATTNGSVAVTVDDQAVEKALAGTTITVSATPNSGYDFVKWTITGATPANETAPTTTFVMPEGAVTVAAEFSATGYDITVTPPTNGTVAVKVNDVAVEKAAAGVTVNLTATPNSGYTFVKWTITGATPANETAPTTTFTMPEGAVTVAAEFAEAEYNITVTTPTNGTINVGANNAEVTKATAGTEITIVATPAKNYVFAKWTVTGATPADETQKITTFIMPAADVTVAAEFTPDRRFYDEGVVINGVKWATRNVDKPGTFAETSRSNGLFYQWNRSIGWSVVDPMEAFDGDGKIESPEWSPAAEGTVWDAANDPCPAGWRLPTKEEQDKLRDNTKVSFFVIAATETEYQATVFQDNVTKNDTFFPNVGGRPTDQGNLVIGKGASGYYWSADKVADSQTNSHFLSVSGKTVMLTNDASSYSGYNVRCVEKTE